MILICGVDEGSPTLEISWLLGGMGLLLAVPLTAFVKLVADLHSSLDYLSNMLALPPKSDSTLGAI